MSTRPRILAFAGSTRKDSYNRKLVRIAAHGAETAGAEVALVDLRDFPMPLFDEDDEAENGRPESVQRFKRLMLEHDGVLLASPEYNSSISGVLKNTIDWVSRPDEGEPPLAAFRDKVVTLMAASPGALGGLRGLTHVRSICAAIGMVVLPDQVAIPRAFEAFDEHGGLRDEKRRRQVEGLGKGLAEFLARLR